MNYGILAAGEGSRLRSEGIDVPKPLVQVAGQSLLDRLCCLMSGPATGCLHVFTRPEIQSLAERAIPDIGRRCTFVCPSAPIPSSLHSCEQLLASYPPQAQHLVVTTVDTIIRPADWQRYVEAFQAMQPDEADGLFVVTPWCDDESPLFVLVDADSLEILAFVDDPTDVPRRLRQRADGSRRRTRLYVSGGVYGFCQPSSIRRLAQRCIDRGESRMRNFQRSLLRSHLRLKAFVIDTVMDVDHASDVLRAEQFLQQS